MIAAAEALERQLQTIRALKVFVRDDEYLRGMKNEADVAGVHVTELLKGMRDDIGILERCHPMYWTKDTTLAVVNISASIQLDQVMVCRELLYCDYGFCWFQEPWLTIRTPIEHPVEAVAWGYVFSRHTGRDCIAVTAYCQVGNLLTPISHCHVDTGNHLDEFNRATVFGSSIDPAAVAAWNEEESIALLRFVVCAGMFLRQKIAVESPQRLDRHARKRVAAAGWTEEPVVSVVMLRERERRAVQRTPDDERAAREYHYQWLVNAHVRQQPYPSRGITLPIIIGPHLQGPSDMPLKPRTTPVFMVNR